MRRRAEFIILARARRVRLTNWWTFSTNALAQVFSPITSITHTPITKTLRKPISRTRTVRSGMRHALRSRTACAITCSGYTEVRLPSLTGLTGIFACRFATDSAGWEARRPRQAGSLSSFPEKFRRPMDFWRQTLVHRTIERGLLEDFAMGRIGRQRNVHFTRQSNDPARRVLRHFLLH